MKKYTVGFVLGVICSATIAFAMDASDIDWSMAAYNYEFEDAVKEAVKGTDVTSFDWGSARTDYDLKRAINRIIEDCTVYEESISC